ncbi:multi-copper oxidase [Mycena polygramma]|nr:multi-copper oxidase [Mycena polygramma]
MPEQWPDADPDVDEHAHLMAPLDEPSSPADGAERWTRRPRRRQRVSAISALVLLFLPFLFLLWMTSWTMDAAHNNTASGSGSASHYDSGAGAGGEGAEGDTRDTFVLDPKFDVRAAPRTRVYRWTVSTITTPNNRTRVVVNGRSPGPLIQANVHDRILVYVTNGLQDEGTSIHWHALPQPETPFFDGTPGISQCPIPPGATLLYNFTLGGWVGTTWWHGHNNMQHTDGLFGPLIIHHPLEHRPAYAAEHVLTLSDVYDTKAEGLLGTYLTSNPMETVPEPVPDRAAINGRGGGAHADDLAPRSLDHRSLTNLNLNLKLPSRNSRAPEQNARAHGHDHPDDENPGYPESATSEVGEEEGYFEVGVKAGTSTRLRLIHAGTFDPLRFSIDNHVLTLIEADGTFIAPVQVRDLVLQPAQRYSVLVERSKTDSVDGERDAFWVRARMVEEGFAYVNPAMRPEARAILRYAAASVSGFAPSAALPTTSPGPPKKDETAWDALPDFDEWALRPAGAGAAGDSDSAPKPSGNAKDGHALERVAVTGKDATVSVNLRSTASGSGRPWDANTAVLTIPWIFSIQRTHGLNWRSFINGTSWEVPPPGEAALVRDTAGVFGVGNSGGEVRKVEAGVKVWPGDQLIATLPHGQTVDFVITNLDDGEHPFHLHGYAPWLLGSGRGRFKPAKAQLELDNPLRRDTFTVPARGWAVVRIVADNPGYWAFHCHIAWHMMGGGLFQIAVPPAEGEMAPVLPETIEEQCRIWVE